MDWTERFEIERFQREERRRLAAEKLHEAWKIVVEKLPQHGASNPHGGHTFAFVFIWDSWSIKLVLAKCFTRAIIGLATK